MLKNLAAVAQTGVNYISGGLLQKMRRLWIYLCGLLTNNQKTNNS